MEAYDSIRISRQAITRLFHSDVYKGHAPLPISPKTTSEALTAWYRAHATAKIQEKVKRYAPFVGVSPSSVGIKGSVRNSGAIH